MLACAACMQPGCTCEHGPIASCCYGNVSSSSPLLSFFSAPPPLCPGVLPFYGFLAVRREIYLLRGHAAQVAVIPPTLQINLNFHSPIYYVLLARAIGTPCTLRRKYLTGRNSLVSIASSEYAVPSSDLSINIFQRTCGTSKRGVFVLRCNMNGCHKSFGRSIVPCWEASRELCRKSGRLPPSRRALLKTRSVAAVD